MSEDAKTSTIIDHPHKIAQGTRPITVQKAGCAKTDCCINRAYNTATRFCLARQAKASRTQFERRFASAINAQDEDRACEI